jgi:hypothetical protein
VTANWLAELTPERAPAPPGWWPLAPGWWALAALIGLLIAATLLVRLWRRRAPKVDARRAALAELQRIRTSNSELAHTARAVESILRRYALAQFGTESIARLSGERWLQFMAERGGEQFSGEVGRSLLSAAFGARCATDQREGWFTTAELFIRYSSRRPLSRSAA